VVADAVADGLIARAGAAVADEKPAGEGADGELGAAEPLAEWERELLEGKADETAATAEANGSGPATTAPTTSDAAADADAAEVAQAAAEAREAGAEASDGERPTA
jgi:small subunit ribosomal protein S2